MSRFDAHWMDEIIRKAQDEGEFDNLPGKGKPLPFVADDPYAGDEAYGYRILKNAGFVPEWVEQRKQIITQVTWLRANPTHPERTARLIETNLLIDKHNRQIPTSTLELPRLPKNFGQ